MKTANDRKKAILKHGLIAIIVLFSVAVAAPFAVNAIPVRAQEAQTNPQTRKKISQTRLADSKLKACQNREKAINNIMARIASRGQKQLDLFDTIASRVEAFYAAKGKTLSNYDELVADVNVKRTAAQTTVENIKSTSVEFKCDGTDPKGAVASFKSSLKAEIAALKTYKTSVKNLIVGVKSAQGVTSSSENGKNQ